MMTYGDPRVEELKFSEFSWQAEVRDAQWIDVMIGFELMGPAAPPPEITELSALLVCTRRGDIAEIAPQDEGRDCEYQFTAEEKAQLRAYYEQEVRAAVEELGRNTEA